MIPAILRGYSLSNEGVRITSQVVLENPAKAQWRTSDDRRHLEKINQRDALSVISRCRLANRRLKEIFQRVLLCLRLLVRLPFRKFARRKMAGILVILKKWPSLTQ